MMTEGELSFVYNERYEWLQQQVKNPENDVTDDYESTDPNVDAYALSKAKFQIYRDPANTHTAALANGLKPKSELGRTGYVLVRAYGAKSHVAIIKEIETPSYAVLDTQTYDAFIIDGVNDIENAFPDVEPDAVLAIASVANVIPELGKLVWGYAREPICTVTLTVGGENIFSAPIYSFPFSDFPSDPIPGLSLIYQQLRLEFNPPLKKFTVNRRSIMVKNGPCNEFGTPLWLPGYDAVAKSGCLMRGDVWRGSPMAYATRENGWTA